MRITLIGVTYLFLQTRENFTFTFLPNLAVDNMNILVGLSTGAVSNSGKRSFPLTLHGIFHFI